MDAVHRLNVGGVLLLFKKKKKKKKSILRYSRALGEIQVFEQSYIIKRVINIKFYIQKNIIII
jgi:hypothetical protein